MRVTPILIAVAMALSGCTVPGDTGIVSAPVTDPYRTGAGGAVVYSGNVNQPGTRLPGSPALTPDVAIGSDFASVGTTVYFPEQESTLTAEARDILARQAAWLAQNNAATATVEGHADEPGTGEFNLALGARRATSVQEYLVAKGVASGRIRTVSFGKERPAAICSSEASCLARNRRVVTVVNAPQAGV